MHIFFDLVAERQPNEHLAKFRFLLVHGFNGQGLSCFPGVGGFGFLDRGFLKSY